MALGEIKLSIETIFGALERFLIKIAGKAGNL